MTWIVVALLAGCGAGYLAARRRWRSVARCAYQAGILEGKEQAKLSTYREPPALPATGGSLVPVWFSVLVSAIERSGIYMQDRD